MGPLPSVEGSEVWARVLQVIYTYITVFRCVYEKSSWGPYYGIIGTTLDRMPREVIVVIILLLRVGLVLLVVVGVVV